MANNRFTKYQLQATSGKLAREWVLDEQDVYVAPLQLVRDVVIHVRRRQNAPGVTIAATRTNDKDPSWQTEVAVPARGRVRARGRDRCRDRARAAVPGGCGGLRTTACSRKPRPRRVRDERLVLSLAEAIDCGDGQWVFSPPQGYNQLVFYRPGNVENALRLLTLTVPLGAATAEPVPFAGGLLVPLQDGNVVLADPVTGGERMHAFHPSTQSGGDEWSRPAVLDGGQEFVIANNHRCSIAWASKTQRGRCWRNSASKQLEGDVVDPGPRWAAACYGVMRSATGDAVAPTRFPI